MKGGMTVQSFFTVFEKCLRAYLIDPREEYLLSISELGKELVHVGVPPEDIAELFGEALTRLGEQLPDSILKQTARLISVPLMELMIAYGMAFREQAAKQRAYEESRLAKSVIENTLEGIWVSDLSGRLELANPAFTHITGYDPYQSEINVKDLFGQPDQNQPTWGGALEELQEKNGFHGELAGRRKNGTSYPAMVSLSAIHDSNRQIIQYVGVLEDISDQKERDASLALELTRAKQIYDLVIRCDLPVMADLRIDVECLPAENVGGDTVEIHKVDENRCLVFIADVVGHGLPAAMTANALKMLFMELADHHDDPAQILSRLNKAVSNNILPDDIIACFCALIDTGNLCITYTLAGLPKPVILREGTLIELIPNGLPLGVFPEMKYDADRIALTPSDLILIFTDGLTEVRNQEGQVLGAKKLLGHLDQNPGIKNQEAIETLIYTAKKHQARAAFADDIIVAAIKLVDEKCPRQITPWNRFCADNRSSFSLRTKEVLYFMHTRAIEVDGVIKAVMTDIDHRGDLKPTDLNRVSNSLFELVSNAVEHGNLEMTKFKHDPLLFDSEDYWAIFRERLLSSEYGLRKIIVDCVYLSREIRISVMDEGPGFVPDNIPNPTEPGNLLKASGRGLSMVKMCVDELRFDSAGRRATMVVKNRPVE